MFEADTYFDLGKKIYVHWALGIRSSCEPSWKTGRPIAWDFSIMEYCFSDPSYVTDIRVQPGNQRWDWKSFLSVRLLWYVSSSWPFFLYLFGMLEYPPLFFKKSIWNVFHQIQPRARWKNKAVMGNIWNMWGANYSPVTWQIATSVDNSLRFFGNLKQYLLIFGTGRGQIVITDTWQYATS